MLGPISQRILTLLQLTRMALVFTAISNGACEVLLRAAAVTEPGGSYLNHLDYGALIAMAVTSIGLYGFGMSLNDIIDHRRDSSTAAHRPLPSGRVGLVTAHAICVGLAALALSGTTAYAFFTPATGWMSLMLLVATGLLITFYDFAGKYLVALGLLSLGLIRFMHAAVAAPTLPNVWHPLLLLNYITLLSAISYHWEQKRPSLTRNHWWTIIGGLSGFDLLVIGTAGYRRGNQTLPGIFPALQVRPALLIPAAVLVAFILLAGLLYRQTPVRRDAGQKLMLYGLLGLIPLDAAFVAGYVSWSAALGLLTLLPLAWWSVQFMRWWSKVISVAHRPAFQRARTQ